MKALSEREITAELGKAPKWRLEGKEIVRTFTLAGFPAAMEFVNRVATQAEKVDHHPDILIQYNKVTLRLSTHDADGLSPRDFAFAHAVNAFAPPA